MRTIFKAAEPPIVVNLLDEEVYNATYCPATNAFHRLDGKWKIPILYLLMFGAKRNSELRDKLSGLTEKVLAQRLDELEEDGIINRVVFPEVPPRVEYSLTAYGETLRPVFEALVVWGSSHEVEV
jgi:DNA-binding HxlR family transcriptional regulator